MNEKKLSQFRWYFTGLVTLTIWSILIWQYFHNGVPHHYLFQNPDLPAISNWWGGLLLPAISWVLVSRVQKRSKSESEANIVYAKNSDIGFIAAFLYGVMLSMTFINGYQEISSVMFPGILFFAIFFRVYREEFILGFILSMNFTFGTVLAMIFGTLIAFLSAVVYFSMQFIWGRLKKITPSKQAH